MSNIETTILSIVSYRRLLSGDFFYGNLHSIPQYSFIPFNIGFSGILANTGRGYIEEG